MRIAVAGATGTVGRHVVAAARRAGHEAVALSRATGQDLTTGAGLAEALRGADAVVDVANVVTLRCRPAERFFVAAARALHEHGAAAGVGHLVALGIVGTDRVDLPYYRAKRAHERAVLRGPVPATVLRATQFHEFPGQLLDRSPGPVALVPRMRSQPVAAAEVAEHLVRLAEGPPLGPAPPLAGPEVLEVVDLARRGAGPPPGSPGRPGRPGARHGRADAARGRSAAGRRRRPARPDHLRRVARAAGAGRGMSGPAGARRAARGRRRLDATPAGCQRSAAASRRTASRSTSGGCAA